VIRTDTDGREIDWLHEVWEQSTLESDNIPFKYLVAAAHRPQSIAELKTDPCLESVLLGWDWAFSWQQTSFSQLDWLTELIINVPLDTKQVISGTRFPANLLASTGKNEKPGDTKYKTYAYIITKSIITQSTMQQEHKNNPERGLRSSHHLDPDLG